MKYAKQGIRFNAVARAWWIRQCTRISRDFLKTLQPMGSISDVKDVADAVLYLARQVK